MAANGMKPKGGSRPGAGRKPKEATILKAKVADFAQDAVDALRLCVEFMHDVTAGKSVQLAAAGEVMNRVWGKPKQAVELSGEVTGRIVVIRAEK